MTRYIYEYDWVNGKVKSQYPEANRFEIELIREIRDLSSTLTQWEKVLDYFFVIKCQIPKLGKGKIRKREQSKKN